VFNNQTGEGKEREKTSGDIFLKTEAED